MGRRLRRRTRWFLRCLFFLPLLMMLAGLLLMRSAAVGWMAERDIEAALGCEARAGASFITFDGRIILRDLVLRVPGIKGPEGEFLSVERAEIDADWSGMLGGGVKATGVRLYHPRFRVSASDPESELNIQGLHPTDPDAMSGNKPLRFDVRSGVLELGEHTPSSYRILREIGINGELIPAANEPGSYALKFQEIAPPGAVRAPHPMGMVLTGRVDLRSSIAVMELLNVDLTSWDSANVPSQMREVWRQLNIKGRIARTKLEYYPTTGLAAVISLDNVSMDAIVPATYPTGRAKEDVLSLRNVGGTIKLSRDGLSADVAGLVEDQTYQSRVTLKTRALTTDAALECRIISRGLRVEKNSTLLPFCPPIVRERLGNFCGPTAVVDADVNIRRDSPGPDGPAPFKVAGWLTFEHGAAAFDRVPYPFTEMSGRVEFDDEGIDILGIKGVGPDGAVLRAKGRIAPPNDDAAVDVDVSVKNVPLDDTFMKSLPPSRAEAIDFLFNRARYSELLAAGLVSAMEQPGGPPAFTPGGRMDLDISVHSQRGKDAPWNYTVDAVIPRAGVLTRAFPLPIAAANVRLRLTEREAKLVAGEFHGLRGGTTGVSARVVLDDEGKSVIRPEVTIDAHGVPIDDLLLHAIEHASGGSASKEAAPDAMPSPAELLRTLRLNGNVDCRAEVTSAPDESINFDIGVAFDELEARPARAGAEPMLALGNIAGSIRLTNTRIDVPRLTAGVRALEGTALANHEIAAGADLGWISASLAGELHGIDTKIGPGGDEPRSKASVQNLHGTLDLDGIELGAPFEESLAAFMPELADKIAEIRGIRHPMGRVSGSVAVGKEGPADPFDVTARITAAENVGFNAAGERLDGSLNSGAIVISSRSKDIARFDDAHVEVGVGDLSRAPLRIDGALLLGAGDGEGLGKESRLTIEGKEIPVESPAVSLVLREVVAPDDLEIITQAHPGGRFDAAVALPSSVLVDDSGLSLKEVVATIVPRSLAFDFEGGRVLINSFTGQVSIRDGSVGVEKLVAHADDWTAGLDGRWERDIEGKGIFAANLDVDADSLTPGVRALFPAGLRSELDRIDLAITGPIHSKGARLVYRPRAGTSSVVGDLRFSGASLDIGAPLKEAEGVLTLHASREAGSPSWSFDIDVAADRVVAAGLEMTGLRSRVSVGDTPGELLLHSLSADCYAGRVTARAKVVDAPGAGAPDTDLRPHSGAAYDAEITLAGVCFAPVLEALDAARERTAGGDPAPMPTELATDPRRGRLDGTLAISGIAGQSTQRSGVGSVRIAGGDVVQMPLVLTLVQLSNFQIPSNDKLDFLQAVFHVSRDQVVLDQIDLLSSSVTISGLGTMSWPDQELDLRFNSRAGHRVPLVSDLFETVRDEIATTRIRGTLGDPRVGAEPLVGTRDLIADIVGDRQSPHKSEGIPDARQERTRYRARRTETPTGRASAERLSDN